MLCPRKRWVIVVSSTKKRIELKSNGGKFQPGHKRFGGRQKGTKNKTTLNIREAMLTAGAELGGGGETGLKNFFIDVGKKKPEFARRLDRRSGAA